MPVAWGLLNGVAGAALTYWALAKVAAIVGQPELAVAVWVILHWAARPVFWVAVIITPIEWFTADMSWISLAWNVASAAIAWWHNGCGGRRRRRIEKALGWVREKAGRLVVVLDPTPTPT